MVKKGQNDFDSPEAILNELKKIGIVIPFITQ